MISLDVWRQRQCAKAERKEIRKTIKCLSLGHLNPQSLGPHLLSEEYSYYFTGTEYVLQVAVFQVLPKKGVKCLEGTESRVGGSRDTLEPICSVLCLSPEGHRTCGLITSSRVDDEIYFTLSHWV